MKEELIKLLEQLVAEKRESWTQGNEGTRNMSFHEHEAINTGEALIKLLEY